MRILFLAVLPICLMSSVNAGPRPFYPEYDDPELQQCLLELTEHLTENTSYSAEAVLRDRPSYYLDARDAYNATRNSYKADDRATIVRLETVFLNQELSKIKKLRAGFQFELWETMAQSVQICSYSILTGKTWQSILR